MEKVNTILKKHFLHVLKALAYDLLICNNEEERSNIKYARAKIKSLIEALK